MKSLTSSASKLPQFLLLVLFLVLAPAALANTTWYVDGVNGNDTNDCKTAQAACKTIGNAISPCSSGDAILVAPAIYTENLIINISLKIIGSGATTTIVDGNQAGTVFTIPYGSSVRLSKLTIRNGSGAWGGGISTNATLTIDKSTVSRNIANDSGPGGGISNLGTLTINDSSITGNRAGYGGGISNNATLTINNSTISGNRASFPSGGIYNTGSLTINNSSITGNSVAYRTGAGLYNNTLGTVVLQNSIVANNHGGNCGHSRDTKITSNGYNLSTDYSCNFDGPGDMSHTKPLLGKLGNHGGPTPTIPLLAGSPAIDAGNPDGCTDSNGNLLKKDQRGWPRPGKNDIGGCDIGAFERQKH